MQIRLRFSATLWAILIIFILLSACSSLPGSEPQEEEIAGSAAALSEMGSVTATTLEVQVPETSEPVKTTDVILTPARSEAVEPDPYPPPTIEEQVIVASPSGAYPAPDVATPAPAATEGVTASSDVFLPITGGSPATATPVPPTPTIEPTLDFAALRADLQANGQDLGFAKIGFHTTILDDRDALDEWMQRLDQAQVPLFLKTVDNAEPLFRAQELMKVSGVPHTLVFRSSGSVPFYELPPAQAAQLHWAEHRDKFPPELDPNLVWIETLNEPDRTKAEWLGQFALETARLAMADGFRWAAFGWASGEPEPEQWQTPSMLAFLRLAAENPDRLAVALHEYSYLEDDIAHEYPYKVGRFQELFRIADEQGIARPTVLITEWGWQYNDVPSLDQVMRELEWAARLYAPYPEVKGVALWNLGSGCCYADISEQVTQLIEPVTDFSLNTYFAIPQAPAQQPINPQQFRP